MLLEERELLAKQPSVPLASEGVPKKELLTNWMRRTRWDETLGQGRRDILVTLSELPLIHSQPLWLGVHNDQELYSSVKNECKLVSIVAALDRLFDRCEETVRYTDVSVRRWLRGRFPDRPYKAPFELVMRPTSERQYRNEFKRCACFWFRVLGLSPSMARSILGQELSQRQREMLEQLWYDPVWGLQPLAAQGATSPHHDEDDLSESEDESDYDCTDDEEDGEGFDSLAEEDEVSDEKSSTNPSTRDQEVAHEDPLGDAILRLCYDMATEDFEDGRAGSCLLVYFSAVRGLSRPRGDEYLRPHQFTPILSRLIYCTRLIFLERILPRFAHAYIGLPARPLYGHLSMLKHVRAEKMCDGTMSPLGEFLSLLAYGRALHRTEGPVYHFHWSEDGEVLSWDGNSYLSMASFRGLAQEALRQATRQSQRLMYEWEPVEPDFKGIRDRLSMATTNYSFVTDPANGLADAYLELFMKACTSPMDGLLKTQTQGQGAWDPKAAQAYLDAHDIHLKLLMVLTQLDGGQGARISELLTIACHNTPSRLRGVAFYGGRMLSITRHHKARLTTNKEFQVARFFSPPVAMLMYRYLIYIRPVAYAILRKCFHHDFVNSLLFAPVSKRGFWSTKTFTEELKRLSMTVPGISFGIGTQLYRQLSIAITEKHLRGPLTNFNRFDDVSNMADESVARAWQSGHRPVQRYSTYGLDGAFPDHMQPSLLQIYAKTSAEWHSFLRIEETSDLVTTSEDVSVANADVVTASNKRRSNQVPVSSKFAEPPRKRLCQSFNPEDRSTRAESIANDPTLLFLIVVYP
ncbi:hypothetical protein F53441_9625 [Fusarium austroafricanum]|uniref:Uncharacterized protein n=1 Tax=Fusarium austroafricanum TaxID=2364996 RepID=A0A8H4KAM2_9HYPO|nr:hypothetical protein F53441_9625 [Fusarium austroafricanum]